MILSSAYISFNIILLESQELFFCLLNNSMTTVDLVHRGKSTIDHVELFDECEFGADRPHIRGCFGTLWEVAYQIAFALNDEGAMEAIREKYADEIKKACYYDFDNEIETHTPKEFGAGNPMEVDAKTGIAMNRYDVPEKKEWENSYKSVNYPHHADYFVQFIIRPKFYADHALITLGIRWNDDLIDTYSSGVYLDQLQVVGCQLISVDDAKIILNKIIEEATPSNS